MLKEMVSPMPERNLARSWMERGSDLLERRELMMEDWRVESQCLDRFAWIWNRDLPLQTRALACWLL